MLNKDSAAKNKSASTSTLPKYLSSTVCSTCKQTTKWVDRQKALVLPELQLPTNFYSYHTDESDSPDPFDTKDTVEKHQFVKAQLLQNVARSLGNDQECETDFEEKGHGESWSLEPEENTGGLSEKSMKASSPSNQEVAQNRVEQQLEAKDELAGMERDYKNLNQDSVAPTDNTQASKTPNTPKGYADSVQYPTSEKFLSGRVASGIEATGKVDEVVEVVSVEMPNQIQETRTTENGNTLETYAKITSAGE